MPRFTAVRLDAGGFDTRMKLASPERMHAAIERSLGPKDGRDPDGARVQWRLDGATLLIASEGTPDRRTLAQEFDVIDQRTADYAPLLARVERGGRWAFRLRANAAYNLHKGCVPVAGDDNLLGWLDRQGARFGFHVTRDRLGRPEAMVARRENLSFAKGGGDGRRIVTLSATTFDGVLAVDDPDLVRRALTGGIGRAKAYGCGMLTLAEPREWQR